MYINFTDKNWTEAKQTCNDNDTILAEPRDNETAKAISVCLGDHPAGKKCQCKDFFKSCFQSQNMHGLEVNTWTINGLGLIPLTQ